MPDTNIPFDQLPLDIQKNVLNQCQSQACEDAKSNLLQIRNTILQLCTQADSYKSKRDAYAAVAAALLAAAIALAVGAAASGNWIAAIVLAIALVACLIAFAIVTGQAGAAEFLLEAVQQQIRSAIKVHDSRDNHASCVSGAMQG